MDQCFPSTALLPWNIAKHSRTCLRRCLLFHCGTQHGHSFLTSNFFFQSRCVVQQHFLPCLLAQLLSILLDFLHHFCPLRCWSCQLVYFIAAKEGDRFPHRKYCIPHDGDQFTEQRSVFKFNFYAVCTLDHFFFSNQQHLHLYTSRFGSFLGTTPSYFESVIQLYR